MTIIDIVGPQQCTKCGQYECNCPGVGDRPSVPGPGKWDYECPGGDCCVCNEVLDK